MKSALFLRITIAILLAGGSSWAQDAPDPAPAPAPAPTKRTFGNGVLPEYLAVYDVNDDGAISVEEGQALRQDRSKGGRLDTFRHKWDRNRDGTISDSEREAAKTAIRQIIITRRLRRFAEVDTNADEFLSLTEFRSITAVQSVDDSSPGTATDLFKHLDKDNDEQVSKAEFLRSLDAAPLQPVGVEPVPPHPDADPRPRR